MAILENDSDYATGDQITAANLNALTESAKFILAGTGVASTGNTTDETTLTVNGTTGELQVKDLGIDTAQLAASSVSLAKMQADSVGTAKILDGAVTVAKMGANSVDSDQYVDGSIDHVHLANNAITGADAHSATNRPDDEDELLVYDNSAMDLVKLSLDVLAKHPTFPQAYGRVPFTTAGAITLDGSYNVSTSSTLTASGSDHYADITFSDNMETPFVVVFGEQQESSWTGLMPKVSNISATGFRLTARGLAANKWYHFTVFGTRAES